jgi:hypothetical protein
MSTQQQPQQVTLEDIFKEVTTPASQEAPKEETEVVVLPAPPVQVVEAPKVENLETTEETSTKPSEYSSKIKTFIEAGLLEDFEITVDGQEVFLSEVNIEDEDTYKTLLEQVRAEKEKQISEKYISKEGLDETTEKLIEIRKAGGSITEILKENVQAIETLQNLKVVLEEGEDKQKEQVAINILAQDLRQRGLSDKVINVQLNDFIESGVLESEAEKILNAHLDLHKQAIDQKRQEELDRINQEKEENKNFKKNLNQQYKGWSIPENIQKVLVENATKTDEYQMSNTDKLYLETKLKNPELFAKVNFFLNNPQEFEKWISGKKVLEAKKDHARSSITINTSKTKSRTNLDTNNLDDIARVVFNK